MELLIVGWARRLLTGALLFVGHLAMAQPQPSLVLSGWIDGRDHQTYKRVPFDVPAGTQSIHVEFDYTNREAKTTIDLGLLGPGDSFVDSFRGWSGGNKRAFTISQSSATPSYRASPLQPGRWHLLLGVPNIRTDERAQFIARISFDRDLSRADTASQPMWLRGDFHTHTGHSDGSCRSRTGKQRVPCPVFVTLETAVERKLDFIAVTDHNTNSHISDIKGLEAYYDDLVIIPGMELTTFRGHANVFNVSQPLDFRIGSEAVPTWNAVLAQLNPTQLLSINHPAIASGESCMGCGWSAEEDLDWNAIGAVEIVNAHDVESERSGLTFWQQRLQEGHRLTAIGGSDAHDGSVRPGLPLIPVIGTPTTVVHATERTVSGILNGVRAGRVFVDVAGTTERFLDTCVMAADRRFCMGDTIPPQLTSNTRVHLVVHGVAGGRAEIIADGMILETVPLASTEVTLERAIDIRQVRQWMRVNVRDQGGKLVLIGNPVYVDQRKTK